MLKYITPENRRILNKCISENMKSQSGEGNYFLLKSEDSFAKRKSGIWTTYNLELHYCQRANERPLRKAVMFKPSLLIFCKEHEHFVRVVASLIQVLLLFCILQSKMHLKIKFFELKFLKNSHCNDRLWQTFPFVFLNRKQIFLRSL